MIFCDKGRIGKMRKTARRVQRINFIPSKYNSSSYRQEIRRLIEDPIEKDSKESYFIQISDIVAYTTYLYSLRNLINPQVPWAGRIQNVLSYGMGISCLNTLLPVLNTDASENDYGIVYYPK